MYHHELAYDMVFVVRLVLGDGGQVPVLIRAAEAAVVKAVNYHWRIRGESGAVGLHLREDDGDRGGGEDPTPLRDGVGQYPEGGRRIGELVPTVVVVVFVSRVGCGFTTA
jgi:hypothetical protein